MRILLLLPLLASAAFGGGPSPEIGFKMHTLDLGRNEAAAVADVNGDGKLDIISGENWYEAPNWDKHVFRSIYFWNNYIDDFSDLPLDVDGDGDIDVVSVGWGGRRQRSPCHWLRPKSACRCRWENPARDGCDRAPVPATTHRCHMDTIPNRSCASRTGLAG